MTSKGAPLRRVKNFPRQAFARKDTYLALIARLIAVAYIRPHIKKALLGQMPKEGIPVTYIELSFVCKNHKPHGDASTLASACDLSDRFGPCRLRI